MAEKKLSGNIDRLFQQEKWDEARSVLEQERDKDPNNHWVLTQLGVTFYEQRQYKEALQLFLASQKIVPDCPLTLWNVAGVLDSLGKYADAVRTYLWLLRNKKSPADDPCWETEEWAETLKTDCMYRLGLCFQHLHKKREAGSCYRRYIDLLSIGIEGSYSFDDVMCHLRDLNGEVSTTRVESEVRKAVNATLQVSGIEPRKRPQDSPPEFDLREFFPGSLAASKK
ncbi:MAG: tetratricopeptide repeat protein [Thermoguttaceae bacterium]|jgi:tetratricopeptide (TPR) repeat protein